MQNFKVCFLLVFCLLLPVISLTVLLLSFTTKVVVKDDERIVFSFALVVAATFKKKLKMLQTGQNLVHKPE